MSSCSNKEGSKKLRVLCLHGFAQTAELFRKKTGSVRKAAKKVAQFEFIDAPHEIPGEAGRGWYLPVRSGQEPNDERFVFEDDSTDLSWEGGVDENTVEISIALIKSACDAAREAGEPFDALLGFSQGAALIPHILLRYPTLCKFAVLFSGFESAQGLPAGKEISCCHSLHCFGDGDEIIRPERSRSIAEKYFKGAEIITHNGGHFVPSSKPIRDALCAFLKSARDSCATPAYTLLKDGARLRAAAASDCADIHAMITELAVYEKEPADIVRVSPAQLLSDFGKGLWHGWVIEAPPSAAATRLLGFALCYYSYSTWEGRCVYLEDLFVRPSARKRGYGLGLIAAVVRHASALGATRLQWQALDWNQPAISFYTDVVGAKERQTQYEDGGTTKWLNFIMEKPQLDAFLKEDAK